MTAPVRIPFAAAAPLFGVLAIGPLACGDDGDDPSDAGVVSDAGGSADAGVTVDTGVVPDTGVSTDAGSADTGSMPFDAGYYCTEMGEESVDGVSVPVPDPADPPSVTGGATPSMACIDREVEPFGRFRGVCFTQCVDFFGFEPTPEQVQELEIEVFQAEVEDGESFDPSFDPVTREDRAPDRKVAVGALVRATSASECDSGYQVEVGYDVDSEESMFSQTRHVIRVRSRSLSNPTWAPLYIWNFIRQNEQLDQLGTVCGEGEARIPERGNRFPVVAAKVLRDAARSLSVTVPGLDDLADGAGAGHVLVETRDCSSVGALTANLTVGHTPAPRGGAYVGEDGGLLDADATSARGLHLAIGVGEGTAPTETRMAVGVNRDGACTEALYGATFPVFPDSVTFVRADRERTIHAD